MGMDEDKKIDITSTALEKGIDVAKGFVDRLVNPSIEELGLLIKDRISLWRFNNQVKILNKAKLICEKNNVSTKSISPKLLCPYLENASLEDDDELQGNWANLLVNMVDSEQNVQNHVFPYILSQISKDEFNFLESILLEKKQRVFALGKELSEFLANKESIANDLKTKIDDLNKELEEIAPAKRHIYSPESAKIRSEIRKADTELRMLNFRKSILNRQIAAPETIPEGNLKEFEMANIIRLGLAKSDYETSAGTHSIEIPSGDRDEYVSVDFDIDLETNTSTILTELGELFIDACCEKVHNK